MNKIKDYSYGIIPVCKVDGELRFLVVRHNAGHWSFPKGHREGAETDLEAASRELFEETGIRDCDVKDAPSFSERYDWDKNGVILDKTVKYFIGWVDGQEIKISQRELQDFRWAGEQEAIDLITYPDTVILFKKAISSLEKK